jgi:hypothetical protein
LIWSKMSTGLPMEIKSSQGRCSHATHPHPFPERKPNSAAPKLGGGRKLGGWQKALYAAPQSVVASGLIVIWTDDRLPLDAQPKHVVTRSQTRGNP